jgi:methylmalonyl-CoA mutase
MTSGATDKLTPPVKLASDFDTASREDWLSLVEKALKGRDFEKKLVSHTVDGLRIEPLYRPDEKSPAAAPPGEAPFTRGTGKTVEGLGWEIHQRVGATSEASLNAEIMEELEAGANGIVLAVKAPGRNGTPIESASAIVSALKGMRLDLAPVQLEAGLVTPSVARHFIAALPDLGIAPASVRGFFNLDPIGTLAQWGTLDEPLEAALADAMALAKDTHTNLPGLRTISVDARPYHEAGASEGQELAALASTLVLYLRTFEAAGVAPSEAMPQLGFALSAGPDQFLTIAKLRAARRIIWRIAEASGAGAAASAMHITATTSRRMMTKRDPWTNLLRTTLACAGAGLGGADAITVLPFTTALGQPDAFARRAARNIQIVLQEEAGLGRVVDSTGGSWYVENLTSDLAAKAWEIFQGIEEKGGIISALGSGYLQDQIAATAKTRAEAIASGRAALTGISTFPILGDDGLTVEPNPAPESVKGRELVRPLSPKREAEAFEALRDATDAYTDKSGKTPQIFLASIGKVIDHTARSTWIKNYLGTGGIAALTSDGYANAAEAASAFKSSGAEMACICSSDALYDEHAEETAKALKAAGAKRVLMAGKPGPRETVLKAAGVDEFLFAGADAIATLTALHQKLGV